jgi:hypothetical protein
VLAGDVESLRQLQCPRGCDVEFVQPLYEEGHGPETNIPIRWEDERRNSYGATVYDLGLRCGNCGHRYGVRAVTRNVKEALNRLLSDTSREMRVMLSQLNGQENDPED